jgi:methylenetetrahydrofolate reductase (NADPH)
MLDLPERVDPAFQKMIMKTPISFEFFPPKTPEGVEKLAGVRQKLYALNPEFFSVTYGAGGSTQDGTLQTVQAILADGFAAAPHFSCIGATRDSVRAQLAQFRYAGIKRMVALRGDLPSGHGTFGEFRYAGELIEFIRDEESKAGLADADKFHIEVGCYPEVHPQAKSPDSDLLAYVMKVKAGASSAITQYFYNSDAYFRFVEDTQRLGANIPVVAGIMPIISSSQLMRFSDACGAEIPRWIRLRLQAYGDDTASIKAFGLDVTTQLCEQLISVGVPGLHFYTMNQATATTEIVRRLNV